MKYLGSLCASIIATLTLGAGCGGGGGDGGPEASLRVINNSDFVITELYLTDVNSRNWGDNLLANDALVPDEHLTLGVACGYYDVLLVDEEGVDCQLNGVDLCLNDATWLINNNTCEAFARKAAERKAAESATPSAPAPAPAPAPATH
jgi:hypothetical protein